MKWNPSTLTTYRRKKHSNLKWLLLLFVILLLLLVGCSKTATSPAITTVEDEREIITLFDQAFAVLEESFDATLGVYAVDTGTGVSVSYRADERFPYASTYKALAAGAVLYQSTILELDTRITFGEQELVAGSPVSQARLDTGMTLRELCEAAVRHNDNTAGNLLLQQLGGPQGFETILRQLGDDVIISERMETDLNEVIPGDIRDTSTPRALAGSLEAFVVHDVLTEEKRSLLMEWMSGNEEGDSLIRAGVPKGWKVADKSGTASYGTRNDIAIVWPPKRDPIVMAILSSRAEENATTDDTLLANAAKIAVDALEKLSE